MTREQEELSPNPADQDDYNESEDADYNPGEPAQKATTTGGTREADEEGREDEDEITAEDRKEMKKYRAIESTTGGLVRTRHQRQREKEDAKFRKRQDLVSKSSDGVDIDSIWASLKGESRQSLTKSRSSSALPEENVSKVEGVKETSASLEPVKVKIKRTYEFAGKVVTEEKWVDSGSQEARAQLNSTKIQGKLESSNDKPKKKKRRKRKGGLLEAVINNSSAAKISTLEKSRLDWAGYVDRHKIHDELNYKNKAGFLANQDFLDRVSSRQDNLYREAKTQSKKK